MVSEDTAVWESLSLDVTDRRRRLDRYVGSSRQGTADWIHFNRDPPSSSAAIAAAPGLRSDLPVVTAATNLDREADLHFPATASPGLTGKRRDEVTRLSVGEDARGKWCL